MIAFLTKSDASERFDQIVDFLNAHVIQYALMVNPTIYVSCIKQFWTSVSIKKTNDVVGLQAIIDMRKVIITKDTIRQALRLDNANGVDCLLNKEIFAELTRMEYEKPPVRNVDSPSKFLMYPQFLQLMINAQVDDLSAHNTKYTSPTLTQKVFANIRRIGKGFSGVDTFLFDGMLVQQQAQNVKDVAEDGNDDNEAIEITKLNQRVKRLEKKRQYKSLGGCIQMGGIAKLDADEDVTLEEVDAEVTMDADDTDEAEPAEVKEVIKVVIVAKLMTEVVTTAATTITVAQVSKASAPRRRRGKRGHRSKKEGSKRKDDSLEQRATKKQKIDENIEELKTHLQIVPNDDEDVYTKATPLALKIPVVDYQIHYEHNKPYYKIIIADGTHQLFLSFITLLKNFDREDLQMLWKLV
nr:hypothetical protein [Tanacetum cinerariifolium]